MIGRGHGLVIECPDPSALAGFYEQVFGMRRAQDERHWIVIGDAPDRPANSMSGLAIRSRDDRPDAVRPGGVVLTRPTKQAPCTARGRWRPPQVTGAAAPRRRGVRPWRGTEQPRTILPSGR